MVDECLGLLVPPPPPPSDTMHLVAGRTASPPPARPTSAELLQQLPGEHALWVLEAVLLAVRAYLAHFGRRVWMGQQAGGWVIRAASM